MEQKVCLHLRNLPSNEMVNSVMVVKQEFDNSII